MQRNGFDALTKALRERKPEPLGGFLDTIDEAAQDAAVAQWEGDCEAIADAIEPFIAEANESVPEGYKYSRQAFLDECGVE